MGISNCVMCGKVMINRPSIFCQPCLEDKREDIEVIKAYLNNHSKPTLLEVHTMTNIPLKTIQALIQEGIISRM
jgi:hypothetical protein